MARASRTNTSRAAASRPAVGGAVERLRLDIDVSKLPKELEATWVREETAGKYDRENVQQALEDRGMRPATYEELNLPKPATLPGRDTETHGLIRRGGSILMVRERAIAEDERDALAQTNEDILRDAKGAEAFKAAAKKAGAETPENENKVDVRETKGVGRFTE